MGVESKDSKDKGLGGTEDFENKGLRELPRYWWYAWFTASMGQFVDAYDTLIIGAALLFLIPLWKLNAVDTGLLAASAFIGVAVGAPVFGSIADRVGRRFLYIFDLTFLVVFGLLSGLVYNFAELFITRLLVGIGVGGDYALSPTLVAEYAPSKRRGFALASMNSFWGIGSIVGFLTAYALAVGLASNPNLAWRVMLASEAIWGLVVILLRTGILESPRWAEIQAKLGGAKKEKWEKEAEDSIKKIAGSSDAKISTGQATKGSIKDLFRGKMWLVTLFAWVWWPVFDVAAYGANLYTPYITAGLGLTSKADAFLASALYWGIALLGYYTAAYYYDRIGRRILVIVGSLIMGIDMFVGLAIYESLKVLPFLAVLGLFSAYYYFMNFGPGPYTMTLAELWPTRVRGTGMGLASTFSRIGAATSSFVIPSIVAAVGFGGALALLGAAILFVALWSFLMMPEASNLTPDELETRLYMGIFKNKKKEKASKPQVS
ncbi:MFS transporter [Metallosphaera javensis (ex Sakai et al. 2022)]|uniref:MFS transporter n=1 Tax=Metallosphaera javensis (ex Sakai et al. 2022) TaxID=2775498 RepID=UPI002586AF16|nr:MAG: putative sialic acid transporter [Metallosphaera javensis (ex Sakai et al. 2022)]